MLHVFESRAGQRVCKLKMPSADYADSLLERLCLFFSERNLRNQRNLRILILVKHYFSVIRITESDNFDGICLPVFS